MMVVCVVIIETTKPTTPSSRKDSVIDATAQPDTLGRSILSQVIRSQIRLCQPACTKVILVKKALTPVNSTLNV